MIGVLSGMGAAAGVHVYDLLIKECQKRGAKVDSDFPAILMYNLPAFGMNEKGIADENTIRRELIEGVALLNNAGAKHIVIACNTVHIYREMLQQKSNALIFDMPASAIRKCEGCSKVGVLSSHTTRQLGLYDSGIKKMLDVECIQVTDHNQVHVDNIISHIISGTTNYHHEIALQSITRDLVDAGAEKVILGCTELPLMPLYFNEGVIVDPAQQVIEEVLDLRGNA